MNNNERRGNFRLDYQNSHETIQSRKKQPESTKQPIKGNYRIDSQGNPILPKRSQLTNQEELEQDYFSRNQAEMNEQRKDQEYTQQVIQPIQPGSSQPSQRVYHMDDYIRRESEINGRMRQPNRKNYVPPQHYSQTRQASRSDRYASANQPSIRRNYSQENIGSNKSSNWYYNLQRNFSERGLNKPKATLPKGRTVLFAVFALLYLTMLITGWQLMPFNKVNQLTVTGTELVPESFIKGSSRIYSYDEVDEVMSQRQAIEAKIKKENPLVESIVFNRPDWKELEIVVVEHDVVGFVNQDGYHPVLNNGEVLNVSSNQELASIASDALPELVDFDTSGKLTEIAQGLRQIEPEILAMMESVVYVEDPNKPNAIEVQMKDGNMIKAIISTFAQKVQYYPDILSQLEGQVGVINFEVGAYFTPGVANANSIKLDNN